MKLRCPTTWKDFLSATAEQFDSMITCQQSTLVKNKIMSTFLPFSLLLRLPYVPRARETKFIPQ